MKSMIKCAITMLALSVCVTNASAQGFLKKMGKKANKVTEVVAPEEESSKEGTNDSVPNAKDFLKSVPEYSVSKVTVTDASGAVLKNEDGTQVVKYYLLDKDGKVCSVKTARKHLNNALKSGGMILLKVGGGAAVGALAGKGAGGKKGALIGGLSGAAAGTLASLGDIKNVKKQVSLMKKCKQVLSAYEKTFTDEGLPKDANVDLSDIDGIDFSECAEVKKSSEEVKNELAASVEEGASLEDVDLEDLDV